MKINVETTVAAPIEQVWRAYTTPAEIKQWNAASDDWHTTAASVDLREGGAFFARLLRHRQGRALATGGSPRGVRGRGQPGNLIIRIAIIDNSVLSLDKAFFLQALAERDDKVLERRGRRAAEKADHGHRALLRTRRERLCRRRAAERPCSRAAECGQQFPPSDSDCHAPLPCEVRKDNDTTP
jgi:Activator of Hsp90 ATPase homolog 1-like protein